MNTHRADKLFQDTLRRVAKFRENRAQGRVVARNSFWVGIIFFTARYYSPTY